MNYQQRTIARLRRHVPGVTVEKPTPTSMHHVVTINGEPARAMVGDGFLTFGVGSYLWISRLAIVPVRKIVRDRALLGEWLTALHTQAAKVQRESAERAANFFRQHEALSFPDVEDA